MNTSEIVLKLIRSVVFERELSASEREDISAEMNEEKLEKIYELSTFHDVAHLVGFALKKYGLIGESPTAKKLYKTKFSAALRCEKLMNELDALNNCLESAGIDHVPLKGAVIRPLYPQAWMRTSCDIDILVREDDLERAIEVIQNSLNYTVKGKKAYHDISLYSPKGTHLELHFSIKENMDKIDKVLSCAWDYVLLRDGKSYEYKFTDEFLLFYALAHASYHFVRGGCGIKSFIDIMLIKQKLNLDKKKVDMLLCESSLVKFDNACDMLCHVWFDGAETDEFLSYMNNYVICGGVYGSNKNIIKVVRTKKGNKIRYYISRIFAPYSQLAITYPIIKKYKILTPFCQMARWCRLLRRDKRKSAKNEICVNNSISKDEITRTKNLISRLELD